MIKFANVITDRKIVATQLRQSDLKSFYTIHSNRRWDKFCPVDRGFIKNTKSESGMIFLHKLPFITFWQVLGSYVKLNDIIMGTK